MSKRGALIKNERTKLYRKAITIIIVVLIVLVTAFMFMLPIIESGGEAGYNSDYKSAYEASIKSLKAQNNFGEIDPENHDTDAYFAILERQQGTRKSLDVLEYIYEHDISPSNWKMEVVEKYFSQKYKIFFELGRGETSQGPMGFKTHEEVDNYFVLSAEEEIELERLKKLLDNDDWKGYVKSEIDYLKTLDTIDVEGSESAMRKELYEMYLEMDIEPYPQSTLIYLLYSHYSSLNIQGDDWKSDEISKIVERRNALIRKIPYNSVDDYNSFDVFGGMNYSRYGHMTHTLEKQTQLELDMSYLRLKENAGPQADLSVPNVLNSFMSTLMIFVTLFGIYLAGSIFASEFSSGTIKLLVITPYKRQKVFWAKVRAVFEAMIGLALALMVLGILIIGISTGFKGIGSTIVVGLFGKAVAIPSMVNTLIIFLKNLVPAIMFTFFALMLSATTRKSAPSIALPMMVYVVGTTITQSIVFSYTNLVDAPTVFAKFIFFLVSSYSTHTQLGISFLFAFIVMLMTTICFAFIGRDSFCRRDIK